MSDLDAATLAILNHGEALMSVLKQDQYAVKQLDRQVFDLYAAKNNFLDFIDKDQIRQKLDEAYAVFKAVHQSVLNNINKHKTISPEDELLFIQELKIFFDSGQ